MAKISKTDLLQKKANLEKARLETARIRYEFDALKSEKAKAKKPVNRFFTGVKSWSAISLTVIAVFTAIYKFYEPIAQKIEIEKSQYDTKVSNDMLRFVNDFNNKDRVDKLNIAALSLSAYELDALPYVLFNMESHPENLDICERCMKLIQAKKHVDEEAFYNTIVLFTKNYIQFTDPGLAAKVTTITNYIKLIIDLDFLKIKESETAVFLKSLTDNPNLTQDDRDSIKIFIRNLSKNSQLSSGERKILSTICTP